MAPCDHEGGGGVRRVAAHEAGEEGRKHRAKVRRGCRREFGKLGSNRTDTGVTGTRSYGGADIRGAESTRPAGSRHHNLAQPLTCGPMTPTFAIARALRGQCRSIFGPLLPLLGSRCSTPSCGSSGDFPLDCTQGVTRRSLSDWFALQLLCIVGVVGLRCPSPAQCSDPWPGTG